jgi:hypothetical protein
MLEVNGIPSPFAERQSIILSGPSRLLHVDQDFTRSRLCVLITIFFTITIIIIYCPVSTILARNGF